MGIVKGGKMAILAGAGPMGLAAIDYILHCPRRPSLLVVTDIDECRISRARSILSPAEAAKNGVDLRYINPSDQGDIKKTLLEQNGGGGYDDVLVLAPVPQVVELGDGILGEDGCLNFFSGPADQGFSVKLNFYNVHYASTHIVGTSGGNTEDMKEALAMMEQGLIDPSILVTHVGGLDAARETTLNLPRIPGGKKLIYTNISLPLTAIADFKALGEENPLFFKLHEITGKNNGLWNAEAERCLLENADKI
jgi:threonine dehydrogenase-like Zn-dependent dehydrogenase